MKLLILKLLEFYYKIINLILFRLKDVSYEEFPLIKGIVVVRGNGKLILGKNVAITSSLNYNPIGLATKSIFVAQDNAIIKIGNNVGISNSVFFSKSSIEIEEDVLIGGGCQIFDCNFHEVNYKKRLILDEDNSSKSILIKKGAFIGASSIILKGITIGTASVIASGSIVVKDVPNYEIWGGNPAKFIKRV